MYKFIIKSGFDFIVAFYCFLVLSPLFLLTTIALAIVNDGNPFFLQKRPGQYNRIFCIIKFKTMIDKKDAQGNLLPDAQRLTSIGSLVRKTSLDEIPQLINVLKGDMSLVGPRPLLVQYLALYTDEQKRRHLVKPGITGWAQINGRDEISIAQKVQLEQEYLYKKSFLFDIEILIKTFTNVLFSKGVSH